jgi:DNA-binding MarR family transcriptional regulator
VEDLAPSSDELAERFFGVAHAAKHRTNARMAAAGLSLARFRVLKALRSGPLRMNEVSTILGVAPRTITTMVDTLEGEGYVVRLPDPSDRRATRLEMTAEGRRQLSRVRSARHHAGAAEMFDALNAEEKRDLARLLDRLGEAMDSTTGQHAT